MADTQEINWDEINVDETITEADQKMSEDISTETPVGKFICTIEACTARENAMQAYTCYAANIKFRIDHVLEIEQKVKDDKGAFVMRNGEALRKKITVEKDQQVAINALFAGRFVFDSVNLASPKEKDSMKNRRLFVAKKIGLISPKAVTIKGSDWAGSVGRRVIIETEWNSWKDKTTGETRKNVRVGWSGYDFAPQDGSVVETALDDDFSDI